MPAPKKKAKLSLVLTDEQLAALKPLIDATGKISIAGSIEGKSLDVSFIACNSPFIACNSPFIACNAPFEIKKKQ